MYKHHAERKPQKVSQTFQCDPKCRAECCGNIPLPFELVENNREVMQGKIIKEISADLYKGNTQVDIITEDKKCVFLNRETLLCLVYQFRPNICKAYGASPQLPCSRVKTDGTLRSSAERKHMEKVIDRDNAKKQEYISRKGSPV